MKFLKAHGKGLALLVLVLFLCLTPSSRPNTLHVFTGFDKFVHFSMYGSLAFIHFNEFRRQSFYGYKPNSIAFALFLLGSVIGLGVEYMQLYLNWGRDFDLLDELSNVLGLLAGLLIVRLPLSLGDSDT